MKGLFSRLFGKKNTQLDEVPTRPLSQDEIEASLLPQRPARSGPPHYQAGFASDVGRQREHNEDALYALTTALSSDQRSLPMGLYIVADGMGGHQYGEVASRVAAQTMAGYVLKNLYLGLLDLQENPPDISLQELLQDGINVAHQAILNQTPGGGTTMTAALLLGDNLTIAHVGDSRAYVLGASGQLRALTRDHSLVKRLVELGQITSDEAAVHPQRNVLYRALGQGEPLEADIYSVTLEPQSYLLICSDGLWGVVAEDDILSAIQDAAHPEDACQALVAAANTAGGPDNITVILVQMPQAQA